MRDMGPDRQDRRDRPVVAVVAAVLLLVVAVVVMALQNGTQGADSGQAPTSVDLDGRAFEVTGQLPSAPAPVARLEWRFRQPDNPEERGPGRLLISARTEPGCNGAGAVISLESGRVVHHFSAATTLMGCPGVAEDDGRMVCGAVDRRPIVAAGR